MGGAEKHALSLADYYKNHLGWDTEVWAWFEKSGRVKEICESINVKTKLVPPFHKFRRRLYKLQLKSYAKIFDEEKVDVVMTFNNKPNILTSGFANKSNIKLHVWAQQGIDAYTDVFQSDLEKKFIKKVPCFISNSFNGKNWLGIKHGVDTNKVQVVQNGILEPENLTPKKDWEFKLGLDTSGKTKYFKAAMVANLTYMKDHVTLVKAWRIVVDNLKEKGVVPLLFFAGRVDVAGEEIQKLTLDLGLTQNVTLLGALKDILGFVNSMDLAVLSSPTEGVPNAVLESMILSKPFAGTNIPGIREAVGEDNYQFLAEEKDAEGLAEKILLFANNEQLRIEQGEKNKESVLGRFSLETMWKETHAIVTGELKKNGR